MITLRLFMSASLPRAHASRGKPSRGAGSQDRNFADVVRRSASAGAQRREGTSGAAQPQELIEEASRDHKPEPPICHTPRFHGSHPCDQGGLHSVDNAGAGVRV